MYLKLEVIKILYYNRTEGKETNRLVIIHLSGYLKTMKKTVIIHKKNKNEVIEEDQNTYTK